MHSSTQRPHNDDRPAWITYWKQIGQPWRTEPEIALERKNFLFERTRLDPDLEHGMFPLRDVEPRLTRADIEWLLATHESGGLIGPVDWSNEAHWKRKGPDLRGAHLQGQDLSNLPLACIFGGLAGDQWISASPELRLQAAVVLEDASLQGAQLQFARLAGANLLRANLKGAILEKADLREAQLGEANLSEATMWLCSLRDAQLKNACLTATHLEAADMRKAHFEGADLTSATLRDSDLRRAHLHGARLSGVNLGGANLSSAHLEDADLTDADMREAILFGSHLEGASLVGVQLEGADIRRTIYDRPDGAG